MRTLAPLISRQWDSRAIKPEAKTAEPFYRTADYRAWREAVIRRAGRRCEAIDNGWRCTKAEPRYRIFADHRTELRDGGAPLDVANGQALCSSHHVAKTYRARAERMRR